MIELKDGTRHTVVTDKPEEYEGGVFKSLVLDLDADSVFPRMSPAKGAPEMSIAELRASIADDEKRGFPGYNQRFMIQQKFSIPVASIVLALIGLALGVSHRKDGRLASFVIGFGVIFVYYVVLWTARAAAIGGRFSPDLAPWIPNIIFAVVSVALLLWRSRSADQPIRISIPAFWRGAGRRARRRRRRAAPAPAAPIASWSSCASRTSRCPARACWISTSRGSTCGSSSSASCRCSGSSTSRRSSISPTSCSADRRRARCCCATSISSRRSTSTTSSRWRRSSRRS